MPVARDTGCDLRIALGFQPLTMATGPILGFLVRPRRGLIFSHIFDTRVTTTAERWHVARRLERSKTGFDRVDRREVC